MTDRQKELREWNWNMAYDDFCENLKHGALTHESWFRDQQKKSRDGSLSDDKNEKLTAVLRKGWEHDHITGLRNAVRCGDIGIITNPDAYVSFSDALNSLDTGTETLDR